MSTLSNANQSERKGIRFNHSHIFALFAGIVRWSISALIVCIIALPSIISFDNTL